MIIGVDPGKLGGITVLSQVNTSLALCYKMPETEADILSVIISHALKDVNMVFIERVGASPQMGVVSAFTFGYGYGTLVGIFTALKLPITFVSPAVWQRNMGCLSGGDKNVTKRRAQQLFPNIKVNHYISDSLLIAEYGRRKIAEIKNS